MNSAERSLTEDNREKNIMMPMMKTHRERTKGIGALPTEWDQLKVLQIAGRSDYRGCVMGLVG